MARAGAHASCGEGGLASRRGVVALVGSEYEENLALRYLASALEGAGFSPLILPFEGTADRERVLRALRQASPLVCGISVAFQSRSTELLCLAADVRGAGVRAHICVGGQVATWNSETILRHYPQVDSVALHDGEATLCELAGRLAEGRPLPGIVGLALRGSSGAIEGQVRRGSALDLLRWPLRRPKPAEVMGTRAAPIMASRGCFGRCTYCSVSAYAALAGAPRHRVRGVEDIAAEMKLELDARGTRLFVFHDDNFLLASRPANLRRLEQLSKTLDQAGLSGVCCVVKCRPDALDPEVVDALRSIGVIRVYAGVDATSRNGLERLGRAMTADDIDRGLACLRAAGLYHSFNLLPFHPWSTLESIEAELAFAAQHVETPFNLGRVEVYSGTSLCRQLAERGALRSNGLGWEYDIFDTRAESLCRMWQEVFRTRCHGIQSVSDLLASTRFEYEVMSRFQPDLCLGAWGQRLTNLSAAIGRDSVQRMSRLLDVVRGASGDELNPRSGHVMQLATETLFVDGAFLEELTSLRRDMLSRVAARRANVAELAREER